MNTLTTLSDCLRCADDVRRKYRKCLLEVGKSADYHVYDLSYDFLTNLKPSPAMHFLLHVKRFYDGLNVQMQGIFLREVLEKNRHYPFWFMEKGLFRRGEFETLRRHLLERIPRSFQ